MTEEFILNRIDGKEKQITKLQNKLDRIQKAQSTGWQDNPYYYSEYDLKYTTRDLEEAKQAKEKYEQDLITVREKANSRNIPAIEQFLDLWGENAIRFYRDKYEEYQIAYKEWLEYDKEYTDTVNSHEFRSSPREEQIAYQKEYRQTKQEFQSEWNYITQFYHGTMSWDDTLVKDVANEKIRKYDNLIERTNAVVGQITNASNLTVGSNGELNGYVIGTKGTASVRTIGAGGYNIQCFHYRTLIQRLK